jgi:hypothetical protein
MQLQGISSKQQLHHAQIASTQHKQMLFVSPRLCTANNSFQHPPQQQPTTHMLPQHTHCHVIVSVVRPAGAMAQRW